MLSASFPSRPKGTDTWKALFLYSPRSEAGAEREKGKTPEITGLSTKRSTSVKKNKRRTGWEVHLVSVDQRKHVPGIHFTAAADVLLEEYILYIYRFTIMCKRGRPSSPHPLVGSLPRRYDTRCCYTGLQYGPPANENS